MRNINRIDAHANRDAAMHDLNRAVLEAFKRGISETTVGQICTPLMHRMKKELVPANEIDRYTSMVRHLFGLGYRPAYLTGRCRSDSDFGGTVVHAVPTYVDEPTHDDSICTWGTALCGAKPARRSNGFNGEPWNDQGLEAVTCPKCREKLDKLVTK
jgi:hypothetical protein